MNSPAIWGFHLAILGLCLWLESLVPLYMDRPNRLPHSMRNLAIGLLNGVVITLGFSGLVVAAFHWSALHPVGLLDQFSLSVGTERLIGFLAFDLWMYLWHRANHTIPFLWRFHRVHHTDLALDSTSGYRFHAGEIALSTLSRLAIIPLLGISLADLVLYEIVLQPIVLFHHSNVNLPERLDQWLRSLVVSPNMHRVHHSDIPEETNSNYASIFSFWDRLWNTYRKRDTKTIVFGLKEFREPRWETLPGMLKLPMA